MGGLVWVTLLVWLVLMAVVVVWALRARRHDRDASRQVGEIDLRASKDRVEDP